MGLQPFSFVWEAASADDKAFKRGVEAAAAYAPPAVRRKLRREKGMAHKPHNALEMVKVDQAF
jgi:hypothetical protein